MSAESLGGYGGLLGSRKYKIVYVNLPKSGCTSIKNFMFYLDNGTFYKDPLKIHFDNNALIRAETELSELILKLTRRHLVFTFIREPFHRVYSCYADKIHNRDFGDIADHLVDNYGLSLAAGENISLDNHRDNFLKFLKFVAQNLVGKTSIRIDYHWQPQREVIKLQTRKVVLDFVGIIEHFERDFAQIMRDVRIEVSLDLKTQFNERKNLAFRLEDIYDDRIEEMLSSIYGTDRDFYSGYVAKRNKVLGETKAIVPTVVA
jgi:hypothetical protein